ncbi:efflux RND transporter periplasmic adaptor subunit [Sulfitobacter sp. F26169L]|nr:efflux RND transporter periplasmic adaptor subunit [Sulfitobacter sp. F26169L]
MTTGVVIIIGMITLVLSRSLLPTDALAAPGPVVERTALKSITKPATPVSVTRLRAADHYNVQRRFSGRIEPNQTVDIAFDEPGKLKTIFAGEGETVTAGAALAGLDTELLEIERDRLVRLLSSARDEQNIMRSTLDREESRKNKSRETQNAIDTLRISFAQISGRATDLEGQITMLDARIRRATLRAPFAGTISQHFADPGSSFEAGQPILRLIENGPRNVRIGVDPVLCRNLSIGDELDLMIGADLYPARIAAIRPDIDPATQTRTVLFELDDNPIIVAGTVATIHMMQEISANGVVVPISALRDGSRGLWEIIVAKPDGDNHRIAVEAVEILNVSDTAAFVRGTFASAALLVTEGQHRLVPGQLVSLVQ